jgi:hypothetical protein
LKQHILYDIWCYVKIVYDKSLNIKGLCVSEVVSEGGEEQIEGHVDLFSLPELSKNAELKPITFLFFVGNS